MNDTERAVMLVEAGKRAAEALAPTKDVVRYPEVVLGCGLPVPLVRAIARAMGVTAGRNPSLYSHDGPTVIESARMEWQGVEIRCQGSRPLSAEDLPKATCSECSGPLEDGMGCTPREGRCGSCVYEGAERARKAKQAREDYEGRQRCIAEDLREDPYTAIGGAS